MKQGKNRLLSWELQVREGNLTNSQNFHSDCLGITDALEFSLHGKKRSIAKEYETNMC